MRIVIDAPDKKVHEEWLYEQLKKMNTIPGTNVCIYDDAEDYGHPESFMMATDESCRSGYDGFRVKARVIFHTDGSAYIDPIVGIDEDYDAAGGGEKHKEIHVETWIKGSWADGLLAIAKSICNRLKIIGVQKGEQISKALANLVDTIGDTEVDNPTLTEEE